MTAMDYLPVAVRKGSGQVQGLSGDHCQLRQLCPRGQLLAFLEESGVLRVRDLAEVSMRGVIKSQSFSSFLWVNNSGSRAQDHHQQIPPLASDQESLLLAVTTAHDIYLYTVGHCSKQEQEKREVVAEKNLPIQKVAAIESREIVSVLQSSQLGHILDSLQPVTTHNNTAVLLANGSVILRLTLPPHALSPSVTSTFSIHPNMEDYSDEALPHFVAGVTAVHCSWPLVFVLTEDGIVLIHDICIAKCIGAVNVVEYCKMVGPLQPETEDLLHRMSTSSFKQFTVSSDLAKLAVATDTNQILLVNLPHYFHNFPTHYSKQFLNPRAARQSSYLRKSTQSITKIVHEEDSERLQYGGLTRHHRALGRGFLGPFSGHHSLSSRMRMLKDRVNGLDPSSGQGLSFARCSRLALDGSTSPPVQERLEEKKWYESKHAAHGLQVDSDIRIYDVNCFTSIRRPMHVFATPASDSDQPASSPSSFLHITKLTYPHSCLLPPADSHVTQGSSLLHLDYGHKVVVAYYGAGNAEEALVSSGSFSGPCLRQGALQGSISVVVVYKTSEQSYSISKLPRASWLIFPSQDNQPVFLVSDSALSLAAFALTQEDFVAKVLMYGSAGVAEEVCYLNRWDQCALPLNALETALDLRQLDIISFFLRNRDDAPGGYGKRRNEQVTVEESTVLSPPPPLPPDQLDAAISLLTASIKRNHNSEHNRQFAEQLLNMTLSFLLRLIKTQAQTSEGQAPALVAERSRNELSPSTGNNEDDSRDLPVARRRLISDTSETSGSGSVLEVSLSLSDLTSHVHFLRKFLPCPLSLKNQIEDEDKDEKEVFVQFLEKVVKKEAWDQLPTTEVIKRSLLSAKLPLAQSYLIHRVEEREEIAYSLYKEMDHSTDSGNESTGIEPSSQRYGLPSPSHSMSLGVMTQSSLLTVGVGFVMEALTARNIKQAILLLTQMGANIKRSLRYIFLHTLQRQARDFLAEELAHRGWLSAVETESLEFLHIVECYYQQSSFIQAISDLPDSAPSVQVPTILSIPDLTPNLIRARTKDIVAAFPECFGGDHPLQWKKPHPSVQPGSPYIQVAMYVVLEWDSALRHHILMEAFILMGKNNETQCHRLIPLPQQLLYHITHHSSKATLWLLHSLDPPTAHRLVLSGEAGRSHYIREILLDELAQMGIFQPVQEENMPDLLYRIGRVHTLCCQPHPLISPDTTCGDSREKLFHKLFISYLIKRDLFNFLYLYLDVYQLALDQPSISELGIASVDHPAWVSVLLHCRLAAKNPSEPSHVFSTSLSCSWYLHSCNSVAEGLRNGHILMAIATMMYAPVPLEEAMSQSNRGQSWYVDPDLLKGALASYPTLQAAVFPPPTTRLTPADSQDVTLYELLNGNVPFDVSQLFFWQSTNAVTSIENDSESSQDAPHFSKTSLSQRYSLTERLTHIYYLQHGQPSFALASFVASKLVHCANPGKRVDHAVTQVYQLALSNFTNPQLTASCAAFIEMLSRDSTMLRVDSQTATRLLVHQESLLENGDIPIREGEREQHMLGFKTKIVSQLTQLYKSPNKILALGIMHKLEKATVHQLEASRVSRCSMKAEGVWLLVQAFCRCHGLPPSLVFLKECAEQGEWLPLLCHAQLHNISLQEVIDIVNKYFSDPLIQEHLHLALSSMDSNLPPISYRAPENQRGGPHSRMRRRLSGSQSSQRESRESLTRGDRDLRAKFYSRVGVQQLQPSLALPTNLQLHPLDDSVDVEVTLSPSLIANVQGYQPAIRPTDIHSDLFTILFKCQDHTDPWRALLAYCIALHRPLLAILAACYKDTVILDCMCAWLCATMGNQAIRKIASLLMISVKEEKDLNSSAVSVEEEKDLNFSADLQWRNWTQQDFGLLLLAAMLDAPCLATQLPLLFHYFDKGNPLLPFMRFHEQFIIRCDLPKSKSFLQDFLLQMDKCTRIETYSGLVGDTQWVEDIATTFTNHMIVACPTMFERGQLLQLLAESEFGQNFTCQTLNYSQLHQISLISEQAGLSTVPAFKISGNFSSSLSSGSLSNLYTVRVRINSDHVLGVMMEKSQFSAARKFAAVAKVPVADVTVKEAESKYQKMLDTSYWQFQPARINFWLQCNQSFVEDGVSPEMAAEFMDNVVQGSSKMSSNSSPITANEQTLLLIFALRWRKEAGQNEDASSLREIWLSQIHSILVQGSSNGNHHALSDLLKDSTLPPSVASLISALVVSAEEEPYCENQLSELVIHDSVPVAVQRTGSIDLEPEELEVLDLVLGRLLNAGLISQARNLASLFNRDSLDLTIVLCCIQLAQGKVSPDRLAADIQAILSVQSRRRLTGTQHLEESNKPGKAFMEVIKTLLKLSDRATHTQKCCECITSCFKIGVVLQRSYESIINEDRLEILADLLSSSHPEKYSLAKSFVSSSSMQSKEVATFLSDCISESLNSQIGATEHDHSRMKVYNNHMTTSQFMELAQLCSDQAILGSHLLYLARSLASNEQPSENWLWVQVEMISRAHDCYTLACSVDGIAEVLKFAREITSTLYKGKHYKLMVQLLTGVGRFHEMSYIIKLLLDSDVFESLVHPGVEKMEQLRVALLDYLRKYRRHDNEKMQMVALKFGMYRELAQAREEQAIKELEKLKLKAITPDNSTVHMLKRIFSDFKDAAKVYVENDCLSNAEHCYAQARLVALQLSLLQSGRCVLNLDLKAVHKFMEEQPFTEALIVADAYKQTMLADWVNPLYKRVVLGGDMRYLGEFKAVFTLTPIIMQELASRYMLDKARPPEASNSMKKLLAHCNNLSLKHKLAQQLGMQETLGLPTLSEGFLKDIAKL